MEDLEGLGYGFHYEGKHFIYMYNEDDEDFLNIALPGIMDVDDTDEQTCYQLINKLNAQRMYIKAYLCNDSIWLFYERELFGGEDLKKLLSRMILHLHAGFYAFRHVMDDFGDEDDHADDDSDSNGGSPEYTEITDEEDVA